MPSKPITAESEQLKKHTRLVRSVEANLKIDNPDHEELRFRDSLLNCAIANLPKMDSFTVRLYEAASAVKFPSDSVVRFRKALQIAIGTEFSLKQYRQPA